MKLPVTESTAPVAGNVATPVYVEEESLATHVEGGAALPVYSVTDADLAAHRFVVAGGQPQRVAIARGTRPVQGGPAIPVRVVGGSGYFSNTWLDNVRSTFGSSLMGIYAQNETSGTVAKQVGGRSTTMIDGVHNGPTLADATTPFGTAAPFYDAIEDYTSIAQPVGFDSVAAGWNEGTILIPFKVGPGVWTDNLNRYLVQIADSALNNRCVQINKTNANQLRITRTVGANSSNVIASVDTTNNRHLDWMVLAFTWRHASNRHRAWIAYRGVAPAQFGATQISAGSFGAITLSSNRCALGASAISTLSDLYSGWMGPLVLGNQELDFTTKLSPVMGFN